MPISIFGKVLGRRRSKLKLNFASSIPRPLRRENGAQINAFIEQAGVDFGGGEIDEARLAQQVQHGAAFIGVQRSSRLCAWPRGPRRHRCLDEILQRGSSSSGDEQSKADGRVARRHEEDRIGKDRSGGKSCGHAASLGQRKSVAHMPTATEAGSRLILKDKGRRHHTLSPAGAGPADRVHFSRGILVND